MAGLDSGQIWRASGQDVFAALPQCRDEEWKDGNAVEEIFAETPIGDISRRFPVR